MATKDVRRRKNRNRLSHIRVNADLVFTRRSLIMALLIIAAVLAVLVMLTSQETRESAAKVVLSILHLLMQLLGDKQ